MLNFPLRSTLLLVALSATMPSTTANAADDAFGLANVTPISDAEGSQVRGLSSATQTFGVSFLSGILFDPDTSSTARAHSLETTASIDNVEFYGSSVPRDAQVTWERVVTLDFGLNINDFQAIMSGTIGSQGFAATPW